MVARRGTSDSVHTTSADVSAAAVSAVRWWRRLLARPTPVPATVPNPSHALRRSALLRSTTVFTRYALATAATVGDAQRGRLRALAATGWIGLAIGAAGAAVVARFEGSSAVEAVTAAGSLLAWAAIRVLIVAVTAPGRLRRESRRVRAVSEAALVPWLLAVSAYTWPVAFAASAWLTWAGLLGIGATPREARVSVAWAFGGQAATLMAAWVARALLLYWIFLRLQ